MYVVETCQHGILLAKVARQMDVAEAFVFCSDILDDFKGVVPASIINEKYLP
jgi:hypothetical protein